MRERGHVGVLPQLTALERAVYETLCAHADEVVSRESLLTQIWGFPVKVETRTVDMCVRRLRQKIGKEKIYTVYGRGYVLRA